MIGINAAYENSYIRLENEVLKVSEYISFDQLYVYSTINADIILRIWSDIESISKDLYEKMFLENNRTIKFDQCLSSINGKTDCFCKNIYISTNIIPLNGYEIQPLHNINLNSKNSYCCGHKKAYMAIKHDRYKSIKYATVENMLASLGALFLLNVLLNNLDNNDSMYTIGSVNSKSKLEPRWVSKLFKVSTFNAIELLNHIPASSKDKYSKSFFVIALGNNSKTFIDIYNIVVELKKYDFDLAKESTISNATDLFFNFFRLKQFVSIYSIKKLNGDIDENGIPKYYLDLIDKLYNILEANQSIDCYIGKNMRDLCKYITFDSI